MEIARVTDSEVVWRVTYLRPDIEKVGALFLAAGERVGRETKRLTRRPAGPHDACKRRHVPPGIPAQVPLVVRLLGDLLAVPLDERPQPRPW